jgi:hypothetical protein
MPACLIQQKVGHPLEDLYRELKAVAPSTRSEYFMMEAGRKVGPQEIEDLAKQLGIIGQR